MKENCQLDELAHEFCQLLRQGGHPTIDDYANRCPQLADEIRDLFPMLLVMEGQFTSTGPFASGRAPPFQAVLPQQVAEYRIVREMGRGGMGVVYEAIHETLQRRVALKILPAGNLPDARHIHRFQREARAAARLRHANIVPIFDVGEADGLHYYAMQYIDGRSLNRPLPDAAAPTASVSRDVPPIRRTGVAATHYRRIATIGRQIAAALAHAHGEGVLHRDIKPGNLILDVEGVVWLTDFGLAHMEGLDDLTSPGDVVGTLRYLPPERFEGHADERGDIYSLGVTLYELLTSVPAFAASTRARLIDSILNAAPVAPRRIDPHIPRDLETIVLKAMAHEPGQRYATADLLTADLDRFLSNRPILAQRSSYARILWRWSQRNTALAGLLSLSLLLLLSIAVISSVASIRLGKQLANTRAAQLEGRQQLFESLLVQAGATWKSGAEKQRSGTLRTVQQAIKIARELDLPAAAFDQLRTEAIAALCLPDMEIARTVDAFPRDAVQVDFDPTLQRYVRVDNQGGVTIYDVSDNRVLERLPQTAAEKQVVGATSVRFSPDGQLLLQYDDQDDGHTTRLRLWDLSAADPKVVFELLGVETSTFRADGQQIAVVTTDLPPSGAALPDAASWARVYEVPSGSECGTPLPVDATARLALHPTLPQLAVSGVTAIRIVDVDTGLEVTRWQRPNTSRLKWSPDGRQLLAASDADFQIRRWDAIRRRPLTTLTGHLKHVDFACSHRGDLIVSHDSTSVRLWDAYSGRMMYQDPQSVATMRFSLDDKWFAATGGVTPKLRLLRVDAGGELRRFSLDSPESTCFTRAVLHPDGRILATASRDGIVLWDILRSERLAVIPGDRHPLSFEPDGSLLTCGNLPEGVVRWPIVADPLDPDRFVVGEKQQLIPQAAENDVTRNWSVSADGRVMAMSDMGEGANVWIARSTDGSPTDDYRQVALGPQYEAQLTSVSPDGRWVATGSLQYHMSSRLDNVTVTVWESATGRRIKDLLGAPGVPCFSPDGSWLAVGCNEIPGGVGLWRVGSWEPGPTTTPIEGTAGFRDVAFDPPRRLMAVDGYAIRIVELDTGRIVAWLSVPEAAHLRPQCFTPDGTHLIAVGQRSDQLYVWDLRAIRQQLAELGLDWDAPPFEASTDEVLPSPLFVQVPDEPPSAP